MSEAEKAVVVVIMDIMTPLTVTPRTEGTESIPDAQGHNPFPSTLQPEAYQATVALHSAFPRRGSGNAHGDQKDIALLYLHCFFVASNDSLFCVIGMS